MKKTLIIAAALLCLISCGRTVATSKHEADKRSFDAWATVYKQQHPEYLWKQTPLGAWLLEDVPGTGDLVTGTEDTLYIFANHTIRNTSDKITSTSLARIAQQLGTYQEVNYYGPTVWYHNGSYAGLEELINGMRNGGRRKVAIPGWLLTYKRYDSPEKYLNDSTTNSPAIYDIELVDHFRNPNEWEIDSIGRFLAHRYPKQFGTNPAKARADSAGAHGFYYATLKAPTSSEALSDTTVYINYIGRLLNGRVFDTTIRDTAIYYGLYNSSKTYSPVAMKVGTKLSEITMGDTSVKEGFARIINAMKANEKGVGVFYSPLGYSTSGSGSKIPPYSPLCFEVQLVSEP